jgi:hypothetical protein
VHVIFLKNLFIFHGSFLVQRCETSHNGFNFPVGAEANTWTSIVQTAMDSLGTFLMLNIRAKQNSAFGSRKSRLFCLQGCRNEFTAILNSAEWYVQCVGEMQSIVRPLYRHAINLYPTAFNVNWSNHDALPELLSNMVHYGSSLSADNWSVLRTHQSRGLQHLRGGMERAMKWWKSTEFIWEATPAAQRHTYTPEDHCSVTNTNWNM